MVGESSQAGAEPEGRLARISRWATAPLVIPLLTGLSFVASTVFGYVFWQDRGHGFYGVGDALPLATVCLLLGIGLGFPLRRAMIRIRDAGPSRAGISVWVLVGVGFAWLLALLVQSFGFWLTVASM